MGFGLLLTSDEHLRECKHPLITLDKYTMNIIVLADSAFLGANGP